MFRPDPEGMSSTYVCPGPRGHAVHTTGRWDKVSALRVLWGGPHTLSSGTKVKAAATCMSVSVTVLHLNVIYTLSDFRFRQVFSLIAFGGQRGDRSLYRWTHCLVASCMRPDWELNPQPWPIGMML